MFYYLSLIYISNFSFLNVFKYLTFRSGGALLTSLIGGRIWIGAIQWTAIITAIASTLIILGVMIIRMASHQFETLITNSLGEIITDSNGSTDIILQVFNNVVGQLTTSIQSQFQIPLIVSLLVLLVTIIYSFMNKRSKA